MKSFLFLTLFLFPYVNHAAAQAVDKDPFGEFDEAYGDINEDYDEVNTSHGQQSGGDVNAAPSTDTGAATQTLFETLGNAGQYTNGISKSQPRWGAMESIVSGARVEDTYEMQMKEELKKPLPKRDPFGDRMNEIDSRFSKKPTL